MILNICISELHYQLHVHKEIQVDENYLPFIVLPGERTDCQAYFELTDEIRHPEQDCEGQDFDHVIYRDSLQDCVAYFFQPGRTEYYAKSKVDASGKRAVVQIERTFDHKLKGLNNYFHMIGWEKMLVFHDRMILHSSCIRTQYGGVLFSGPSGIGKSTQAELWMRCRGAELINGDRTILYRSEGVWRGYGSPFAGSSQCYRNESVPVRAVVMLGQGQECQIRKLPVKEAFYRLYAGMAVYTWNQEYVSRILDLISVFAEEVPVYSLVCTPDEEAVNLLDHVLEEDRNGSEL